MLLIIYFIFNVACVFLIAVAGTDAWEFFDWVEDGFKKNFTLLHLIVILLLMPSFIIFFMLVAIYRLIIQLSKVTIFKNKK